MDEPLRRVAEDHGLLRAPRVRIAVLQPATRKQHVALDQRVDDGLVGVALLAVVVDDAGGAARPVRTEARRVPGEIAGVVHGEGDARVDAPSPQTYGVLDPGIEVLAAMAGRRMHEAGAGVV